MHALIIENNRLNAMMIKEDLRDHGYGSIAIAASQHLYENVRAPFELVGKG